MPRPESSLAEPAEPQLRSTAASPEAHRAEYLRELALADAVYDEKPSSTVTGEVMAVQPVLDKLIATDNEAETAPAPVRQTIGHQAVTYEQRDGYSLLHQPSGIYRIDKTPRLGSKPDEAEKHKEASHSTTFERLKALSHRVILYVENSVVHHKPKETTDPESKPEIPIEGLKYEMRDGYSLLWFPNGDVKRIEKSKRP